jgi:hypothetical protein
VHVTARRGIRPRTAARTTRRSRRAICVAVVLAVVAAGCAADEVGDVAVGAQTTVVPPIRPLPVPTTAAPVDAAAALAPGRYVTNDDGVVLPDPDITPGAIFDDVTAVDVCDAHYTQGIRQPRYNRKVEAFAGYGVSIHDRDSYQVDHLVPISLGGSNAVENIWPQPVEAPGAADKDALEVQLHALVCSQQLTLVQAQELIATDWWSASRSYMDVVVPAVPSTATPRPPGELVAENGQPCEVEGSVGYTDPKHIRLICTRMALGDLRWQKRY